MPVLGHRVPLLVHAKSILLHTHIDTTVGWQEHFWMIIDACVMICEVLRHATKVCAIITLFILCLLFIDHETWQCALASVDSSSSSSLQSFFTFHVLFPYMYVHNIHGWPSIQLTLDRLVEKTFNLYIFILYYLILSPPLSICKHFHHWHFVIIYNIPHRSNLRGMKCKGMHVIGCGNVWNNAIINNYNYIII